MVDVLLSAAELKSAPHHVKEWIRATILEGLALEPEPEQILEKETELVLAECSFDETNLILQQIRDDYIACQVFFELSRDDLRERLGPPDLHRIPIAHILSHTRLSNPKHFSIYLNRINEALQAVRQDSSAVLFASDRAGGLYVHDTTRRNIKALWQALVSSRMPNSSEIPGMAMPVGPAVPLTARPQPEAG